MAHSLPSILLVSLSFAVATSACQADEPPLPPNVVIILSDDQGWTDYGFMGHPEIQTPNLDQLARRSLVFSRGYVPTSLCRPSLASIVTGLYPYQHGVVCNDVDRSNRDESDLALREQFHRHPSLIKQLVAHGYFAFQTGKWWEGSWRDAGFTGGMTHGDPQRGGRHGDLGLKIGRNTLKPATEFIDQAVAEQKPFLLWYAPFMPHTPHTPPARLLDKYRQEGRPANVARYYAMCEWFDESCGELLDHLQQSGAADNTIVVYLCDNGWAPAAEGDSSDQPADWWLDYAPRTKTSPYELGVRTPIMIAWPKHLAAEQSPHLASSLDLMPTLLTACNISPPENLPGINLLDPQAVASRKLVFGGIWSTHNAKVGDTLSTLQYRWCVGDRWKLLLRHHGLDSTRYRVTHEWDTDPVQLFDLQSDPGETTNVADQHPALVERLTKQVDQAIPGQ
ncbi:sulfatase family protein [Aeoliella mucimassa]|uniref:Arylsulfatase n=1 Tax=Aeoliella mucimassa TaxID=2527972 RepID=A0A518ARZ9_9BACT|nr:sulfatase-like hydrolase/transferase [Aeoliella mucimassa]QDU57488.1 Arylsulfatase precursor [Aeoliella mucimassa]